ncbi:MAG TPA: type II toxin-antitoxin system VapC family toxin [Edaphobacter sp.]|jgi:predicted nucleic acid-binding protein|nr:type II toxin-antitoxin system VapC family toxin [Edaphobacter sp.]
MSRIFWDTNLFIYLFDKHPEFFEPTAALRRRMTERKDDLMTSAMTLGEIQVGPRRSKDLARAGKYRDAIHQSCKVLPFDEAAADIYAQLRENPAIKPPDAIQLSCAAAAGVELFITNDVSLHKLAVPGIHFVTSLLRVPI